MTNSLVTVTSHPGADPVLLIHGFASGGAADWEQTGFVAALATAGRGALAVHLPGHDGGPALARGGATTSTVVAALADVIVDAAASVDVVGYSLGARLAWTLAATGRVRRLVLGGLSPMDPFARLDVDALAAVVHGEAAPADPLQGMFARMLQAPGLDADSVLALIAGLAAEPFDPTRDVPAAPTLFLSGDADPMAQGVDVLAASVPGAVLRRVPGDHLAALASPEFRAAALEFLA